MDKVKRVSVYLWIVLLIVIEQITKMLVIEHVKGESITIIKGILKFTYCENEGVAFSIGNGHVPVFIVLNIFIILFMVIFYEKNRADFGKISKIFFTMVIAGGLSNLIDRMFRGYVVDFIDVNEWLNFAIFNIADIFIVVGILGTVVYGVIQEIKK